MANNYFEGDDLIADIDSKQTENEFFESINSDVLKMSLNSNSFVNSDLNLEGAMYKFFHKSLPENKSKINSFFSKTQRWVGHVSEINGDIFIAKLEDLTNSGTYEFGEFEMTEISPEDKKLVQIGAAFYWSVGYSNHNGQVRKESIIRFQRTVKWDQAYLNDALDNYDKHDKTLKWI